jgi:PhoPQ-activated pathogenicity-related protein
VKISALPLTSHIIQKALLLGACALLPVGCRAQEPKPATAAPPATIPHELDDYIARPETVYKWEKMAPLPANEGSLTGDPATDFLLAGLTQGAQVQDLQLTSLQWQGGTWTHRLQIVKPAKMLYPDRALLIISYGNGSAEEATLAKVAANTNGAPAAILFGVPNQPLFGLKEDALIAHTFVKYLETGESDWPLLFPMTKSAVKAMDAISEYSEKEWGRKIDKFVVSGASKRGWTTWLTAAADKRVVGIVPMVYNNLNLGKQMPHQLESWGAYSRSISDYTEHDLPAALQTPRGQYLASLVDPWTYRERFTMPKLIINATNDSYWPLDAMNLYRAGLPGETNAFYAPNTGHSMGGQEMRVFGAASGWFRRLAMGRSVPQIKLTGSEKGEIKIEITGAKDEKISGARLWVARSATRDFRQAQWKSQKLAFDATGETRALTEQIEAAPAETPYSAAFAEIDLPMEGSFLPFRLSSDVFIWKS